MRHEVSVEDEVSAYIVESVEDDVRVTECISLLDYFSIYYIMFREKNILTEEGEYERNFVIGAVINRIDVIEGDDKIEGSGEI